MRRILFCLILLSSQVLKAQICTLEGQTPVSALLVCGTATYSVITPGLCGQTPVPGSCTDGFPYTNKNPNFFRMACFNAGTLGFTINPSDPAANYDWQLFDITFTNPVDIFTNPALFVACNWSSDPGETGASSLGTSLVVCSGSQPLFSKMPDLQTGRTYLLMVVNQGSSTGSYELDFGGGSADITDPLNPDLFSAGVNCNGTIIGVRLNKQLLCNTVAADGSDFTISGGVNIIAAYPGRCNVLTGSDSVYLVLAQSLPNGTYIVTSTTGTDGNTLKDICDRSMAEGETVSFTLTGLVPTPMDSLTQPGCRLNYIELVFKKPILCNSIAPDGSDFLITGPQVVSPVVITTQGCLTGNATLIIRLGFSPASIMPGIYQVQLVTGSDGNSLLDYCGLETPPGATLSFTMSEPVSAQFTYLVPPACRESNVSFSNVGTNVTNWQWTFDNSINSGLQNPQIIFANPGNHTAHLIVSNSKCADTSQVVFSTPDFMTAAFNAPSIICPGDTLQLENVSGNAPDAWLWDLGNGVTSMDREPSGHRYGFIGQDMFYTVRLTATNTAAGCSYTVKKVIRALAHCTIAVPSAFTPNGDGKNDHLYPLNAVKADQLEFRVYNRLGQLVFRTRDWNQKWDGRVNGRQQDTGVYAWLLSYVHHDTGEKVFLKGTTLLLR